MLDKPAGLLSVPGRGPYKQDCLIHRALHYWPDALVVHRLDMATSGLLLLARNKEVQRQLGDAFAAREIHKRYTAVVAGDIENVQWQQIDAPLRCDWERRPLQMVDPIQGKPSQTLYRKHANQSGVPTGCTKVDLEPITGRSHQLRVHMMHMGYPMLGDTLYAPAEVVALSERLCLHATSLQFKHPVHQEDLHFYSAAPF